MSFPNTIYGKYGWEKVQTSTQKHKLGTRMSFDDGRVFRYVGCGGTGIAAGRLVQAPAGTAEDKVDTNVNAASAGDTTVTLAENRTITKDEYKNGYLFVNSGTGVGEVYRIKSNTAVSGASGCVITLDEEDGLVSALAASGSTEVGLALDPYNDVIVSPTTVTNITLGATTIALTADYFGWIQTWGWASVLANAAGVVGEHVRVGGASTAGGTEDLDRDGSGENEQAVGIQTNVAPTNADHGLIYLTISP